MRNRPMRPLIHPPAARLLGLCALLLFTTSTLAQTTLPSAPRRLRWEDMPPGYFPPPNDPTAVRPGMDGPPATAPSTRATFAALLTPATATGPASRPTRSAAATLLADDEEVLTLVLARLEPMPEDAPLLLPLLKAALRDSFSRDDIRIAVRVAAANAVAKLGPAGADAVNLLIPCLSDADPYVAVAAADALGAIGWNANEALPALEEQLTASSMPLRSAAVMAIGKIAPHSPSRERKVQLVDRIAGRVFRSYNDVSADAAGEALVAFGELGLKPLLEQVPKGYSPARPSRRRAIRILPSFGDAARGAAPELRKILADQDDPFRIAAIESLTRMSGHDPETWRALFALAANRYAPDRERDAAETALRSLTPNTELVSHLASHLSSADAGEVAAHLLLCYGDAVAPLVVGAVLEQLPKADVAAKRRMIMLLGAFGPASRSAVPVLLPMLNSGFESIRLATLSTLAQIGPDARAATHDLLRLLRDPSPPTRGEAASALARIAPDEATLAAELVRAAKEGDWVLCVVLAPCVQPRTAGAARAQLTDIARQDPLEEVRARAWYALRDMGVPMAWLFSERRAGE